MVKRICLNEILFAEIYYICVAIMLILGFKTYRSMMKNDQKVSFLAVVFLHILYFQTDLVRMSNVQNLFLNEMSFLFFSLCTFSWFNYILTQINDTYGHAQGDLALKAIAKSLKQACIEKEDFIALYGGDEFVIVYKGENVEALCQRIHTYIQQLSFLFDLDVSIGYAQYKKEMRKWNDWFIKADQQLYDEKKKLKGR